MEKRIKQSDVWAVMQQKDDRGRYKMFSFSYVRLNESREGNGSPGSIENYEVASVSYPHLDVYKRQVQDTHYRRMGHIVCRREFLYA